jgi:hypothetical protein
VCTGIETLGVNIKFRYFPTGVYGNQTHGCVCKFSQIVYRVKYPKISDGGKKFRGILCFCEGIETSQNLAKIYIYTQGFDSRTHLNFLLGEDENFC